MIDAELTRKLAQLARLGLSDAEVEKFTKQLDGTLGHCKKLQEVDTSDVEEISQITGLTNVLRPDVVRASGIEQQIIEGSPNGVQNGQIQVQSTF